MLETSLDPADSFFDSFIKVESTHRLNPEVREDAVDQPLLSRGDKALSRVVFVKDRGRPGFDYVRNLALRKHLGVKHLLIR